MKRSRIYALVLVAASCLCPLLAEEIVSESQLVAVSSPQGVTVLEGIRPVLTYQRAPTSLAARWPRANYVHPLYDLDGEVLTEDFPIDHGHQRGVFWAWHQVLVGGQPMGDAWACVDFQWDVVEVKVETFDERLAIQATTLWKSPALSDQQGALIPFVREQTTITVHRAEEHLRWIDFSIELLALRDDVAIGGSDDDKGYGGFSPRLKLSDELTFMASGGKVEPVLEAIAAGPWIDISSQRGGVAIFTHHENPGFPTDWILRRSRSMQNAVYPGRIPVPLSQTQPLRLRYRLGLHRGVWEPAQVDQYLRQYHSADAGNES